MNIPQSPRSVPPAYRHAFKRLDAILEERTRGQNSYLQILLARHRATGGAKCPSASPNPEPQK